MEEWEGEGNEQMLKKKMMENANKVCLISSLDLFEICELIEIGQWILLWDLSCSISFSLER